MLDLTEPELHIVHPRQLAVLRRVPPRLGQHLRRHVHANSAPGRPHLAAGDENIEAATAAKVEHRFAGLQRGERGGVAAGQTHVRTVRQRLEFAHRIAEFASELVGIRRR